MGIYINGQKDTRKLRDVAMRMADILRPPDAAADPQTEMSQSGLDARA
jgi:hypothetical protein